MHGNCHEKEGSNGKDITQTLSLLIFLIWSGGDFLVLSFWKSNIDMITFRVALFERLEFRCLNDHLGRISLGGPKFIILDMILGEISKVHLEVITTCLVTSQLIRIGQFAKQFLRSLSLQRRLKLGIVIIWGYLFVHLNTIITLLQLKGLEGSICLSFFFYSLF